MIIIVAAFRLTRLVFATGVGLLIGAFVTGSCCGPRGRLSAEFVIAWLPLRCYESPTACS